ncbi:MAG: SRPBCC family protein [Bacteroidetes bacterium]|nr:SRPBCC family protein [Bacteroidota bacterium]
MKTNLIYSAAFIAFLFAGVSAHAKEKKSTIITQQLVINAPVDKAWQVLGPQFADAYKWAASVEHSEARDHNGVNGSNCTERGCDVSGIGSIKEKILTYSDTEHILYYEVYEGMPKMVTYMTNYWQLTATADGKTRLDMKMEMKTGGMMGAMMKGMMKKKMTRLSAEITEEFKYYVETGQPHPRKVKASNKH